MRGRSSLLALAVGKEVPPWYDPLACTNTVANPYVGVAADLVGHEGWEFWQGVPITGWRKGAWLRSDLDNDGEPDDALQSFLGLPIFSAALQSEIKKAGIGGIQFLPIDVLNSQGVLLGDFAIANVVDVVDALDFERSTYEVFEHDYFIVERRGRIRGVSEIVLRGDRLVGHDLIRLEGYPIALLCSDRIRLVFEEGGFTGYTFPEISVV